MSSTEFNVGLVDGRSSSRVLKPPGGGHSNIFGAFDAEKPKIKARQQSEIKGCFEFEEKKKDPVDKNNLKNELKLEIEEHKEKDKDVKEQENAPPEKKTDDVKQSALPRVRVPPGGFSSGLW